MKTYRVVFSCADGVHRFMVLCEGCLHSFMARNELDGVRKWLRPSTGACCEFCADELLEVGSTR